MTPIPRAAGPRYGAKTLVTARPALVAVLAVLFATLATGDSDAFAAVPLGAGPGGPAQGAGVPVFRNVARSLESMESWFSNDLKTQAPLKTPQLRTF